MRRFIWNVRYAMIMKKVCGCSFEFAYDSAVASDDSFNDGETPDEAVAIEMSYWEE